MYLLVRVCVRLMSPRRIELKEQNAEIKQLQKLVFQLASSQASASSQTSSVPL